jgi:hypothetical protein
MELTFFVSDTISLRTTGFYLNSEDENDAPYRIRNIMAAVTYCF